MSAHCNKCGNDLVYAGEWPAMECPVCTVKADRDCYQAALREIAGQTGNEDRGPWDIAREALGAGKRERGAA